MNHLARFVGGSIGGEVQSEPGPQPRYNEDYRVPVMSRAWVGAISEKLPRLSTEVDVYRWEGEQRNGEYIYRYVRPNIEGMQVEIRQLKKRVEELSRAEEALEALKKLQTYLNNGF